MYAGQEISPDISDWAKQTAAAVACIRTVFHTCSGHERASQVFDKRIGSAALFLARTRKRNGASWYLLHRPLLV